MYSVAQRHFPRFTTKPGENDQNWHRDGPWPVDPNGTPYGSLPGQINCGYFLDELTMENGPIVIVPGSQRSLFSTSRRTSQISRRKVCDGQTRASGFVRRMALSSGSSQPLRPESAGLLDVLSKRLDEVERTYSRTTCQQVTSKRD